MTGTLLAYAVLLLLPLSAMASCRLSTPLFSVLVNEDKAANRNVSNDVVSLTSPTHECTFQPHAMITSPTAERFEAIVSEEAESMAINSGLPGAGTFTTTQAVPEIKGDLVEIVVETFSSNKMGAYSRFVLLPSGRMLLARCGFSEEDATNRQAAKEIVASLTFETGARECEL